MGETAPQLEASLRAERTSLDRNLRELEVRARQAVDWREHYHRHPGAAVGLAFGAGMVLGLLAVPADDAGRIGAHAEGGPAPTIVAPTPRYAERGQSRMAALGRSLGQSSAVARAQSQAADTLGRVGETLLALAAAKVIHYVAEVVPGFADEFDRRGRTDR